MSDIKSQEARSRNMAAIRNKDTKPELYLRKLLFAKGYRYKKNVASIPGHPDIYLKKFNTAVFVHGCFWHQHAGCSYAYFPKSRMEFWSKKFERNIQRDLTVQNELRMQGVKCLIVWECTIRKMQKSAKVVIDVTNAITEFFSSTEKYKEL